MRNIGGFNEQSIHLCPTLESHVFMAIPCREPKADITSVDCHVGSTGSSLEPAPRAAASSWPRLLRWYAYHVLFQKSIYHQTVSFSLRNFSNEEKEFIMHEIWNNRITFEAIKYLTIVTVWLATQLKASFPEKNVLIMWSKFHLVHIL